MRPAFIVIGAMKSGTDSLRHYLGEHPEIFIPPDPMEPSFFVAELGWERGVAWYESLFAPAKSVQVPGECSPCYSMAGWYDGVPERMAAIVPDARLVYLLRHPIERMRSMYIHQVAAGRERRAPAVALRDERYLGPSRYGMQLERYLEHYERERIVVLTSEQLRHDPHGALRPVFAHLGVRTDVLPPGRSIFDNVSAAKRVPVLHGRLQFDARRPFKNEVSWRPDARRGIARLLTTRAVRAEDSEISADLRSQLWDALSADLNGLRSLVGADAFDSWGWS